MVLARIVIMGVSGCGKTTVARELSQRTGLSYVEADDYHPAENVERMRAGVPLGDAERTPWLRSLSARLAQAVPTVLACSALRRAYRDILRSAAPDVVFVHLDAPAGVLRQRLAQRVGHYMPASLLDSQLSTLEGLEPDERGLVLDALLSTEDLVAQVISRLGMPELSATPAHRTVAVMPEIIQLLASPVHRYEGRPADGPAPAPKGELVDRVEIRAGLGIVGDRYFGQPAHRDAAVTLIAEESLPPGASLVQVRRNVLLRGLPVDGLVGKVLVLDCGEGPVRLAVRRPANPCAWMDATIGPGARDALRGKGGVRCAPLTDGVLRRGPVTVRVEDA